MKRRDVILTLPAILALGAMSRPAAAEEAAAAKALAADLLASGPSIGDRGLGKPDAPVVMIEYSSATCPHCAAFHGKILPQLRSDYIDTGKLRFIYREFPLDKVSMGVSLLARCVPEDKFFLTLDVLFRRQKIWMSARASEELFRVMQLSGMNQAQFDECLLRKDLVGSILASATKARDRFGVRGTPAIFINGRKIDGHKDYAAIKTVIDAELAR